MRNVLPRGRASEEGVDARALLSLVEALDASDHEPHSLMVLRRGKVIAEGWWAPYRPERPHMLYSLSKSVTSMAVGFAVEEGLLGLDEPLIELLPGHGPQPPHERAASMTLRHALTMTTGHDTDPILTMFPWIIDHPDGDWLDGFFELVPDHEPGWPFTYNQLATHAAARAVEARSGRPLLDYLEPRLLEPLGMHEAVTLTNGEHALGFAGLFLRTESVAAFGQLCLDRGRFGDEQIAPAGWVEAATSVQVPNDAANRGVGDPNPDPDWNSGYGYQFWRCRHGFRGDGALGQFCLVWPEEEMVIATTAAAPDMQAMLDLVESELAGSIDGSPAPDDEAIEEQLRERCRNLKLPIPEHVDGPAISGSFHRAGGDAAPSVRGVRLSPTAAGWMLTFDRSTGPVEFEIVPGAWTEGHWPAERGRRAQPVAAAGGREAGGHLHAEIALVTTPHRLLLDADPSTGEFTLGWNQFPLHGAEPADLAVPS